MKSSSILLLCFLINSCKSDENYSSSTPDGTLQNFLETIKQKENKQFANGLGIRDANSQNYVRVAIDTLQTTQLNLLKNPDEFKKTLDNIFHSPKTSIFFNQSIGKAIMMSASTTNKTVYLDGIVESSCYNLKNLGACGAISLQPDNIISNRVHILVENLNISIFAQKQDGIYEFVLINNDTNNMTCKKVTLNQLLEIVPTQKTSPQTHR